MRPFPEVNSGHWQVSTAGGTTPVWARSGAELFYLGLDGALMALPIERRRTWSAGTPAKILEPRYYIGTGAAARRMYDVSPDGRRFLMIKAGAGTEQTAPPSVIVVQNWFEELKRLVPTK